VRSRRVRLAGYDLDDCSGETGSPRGLIESGGLIEIEQRGASPFDLVRMWSNHAVAIRDCDRHGLFSVIVSCRKMSVDDLCLT
jgi:hypothetical protein